ncbi:MAG: M23 family metallopeptidase [Brevundimonas sp.]
MRRLTPTLRSFVTHTGHLAALLGTAVLAMAMAPMTTVYAPETAAAAHPVAAPVTAVAAPAGPVTRQIVFEKPLKGFAVNSPFGFRKLAGEGRGRAHKGVDMAAPRGTSVYAAAEGRVLRTGYDAGGYGNFVEVRHPNGMTSLYGHLSRIDVASGMQLSGGQRLGLVGSTGYSTGPHLHFEVKRGGVQVNPARIMGHAFRVAVKV